MEIKGNVIVHGNFIEHQEITVESGGVLNFGGAAETDNENSDDELREKINVVMNLISSNRHWFSIAKVLMLRGLVKDGDFKGAQERIESLYPGGLKYPIDYADLMRMNVGSFAGPIDSWNTTDGPIKRQAEFKVYVTIAKKFDGLFSFK